MQLSDEPKFGRRATRWFRFRIADWFQGYATKNLGGRVTKPDVLSALTDWFAEMPRRYVKWVAAECYSGSGYSAGGWELDQPAILEDLDQALVEATRRAAAAANAHFKSLDEWLAADLNGTLARAPMGGSEELSTEYRVQLAFSAHIRRNRVRVLKSCPSCETEWEVRSKHLPADRIAKRCPNCRASGSRKRTTAQEAK